MHNLSLRAALAIVCVTLLAPPQAFAAGKSLKETLAFVRDRFSGQGEISYKIKLHDSADGSDWSNEMTGRATNVSYDVASCTISYHWTTSSDGKTVQDFDASWDFSKGRKVSVVSREEEIRTQASNDGHTTWTAIVSPSVWVVTLTFTDTTGVANFTNKDTAERVSRAIDHAMDLCHAPKDSF